jgi:endonuclease YncB( thermonuclease family)
LDGVRYEEEKYSDGDSFRATRNTASYVFRLYYVDAPETDSRYPDRNQEQADYFGVSPELVVKGGKMAAEWLHDLLEAENGFTVYTRYANARGGSSQKRYYAMVKIGDRWLSELLVENGLVRMHGVEAELPDGTSSRIYWARLRKLEREAKEAHRGIWGLASGRAPQAPPRIVKLTAPTPIFQAEPPHRMVGTLPAGWRVTVGAPTRTGFRTVRFTSPGGNPFTGEIQESQLP